MQLSKETVSTYTGSLMLCGASGGSAHGKQAWGQKQRRTTGACKSRKHSEP